MVLAVVLVLGVAYVASIVVLLWSGFKRNGG